MKNFCSYLRMHYQYLLLQLMKLTAFLNGELMQPCVSVFQLLCCTLERFWQFAPIFLLLCSVSACFILYILVSVYHCSSLFLLCACCSLFSVNLATFVTFSWTNEQVS
jgi:hypothetical protein